jgi:uncharacterized membrane protein (DUF373 family)
MPEKKKDIEKQISQILNSAYRFEYIVVLILVLVVGLITILAMARLFVGLYTTAFSSWDVTNYQAIPVLFGLVMTVVIAMELGNSILRHIRDHSTIIQAKEVVLIGIMAVVRKVMIVDTKEISILELAALGFLALSLAGSYWLLKQNERITTQQK